MNNLAQYLKIWAINNFGISISDHRLEHITQEIEAWLPTLELNELSYLKALQEEKDDVIRPTINFLTVQESYFFRDSSLFIYLKNSLLPQIINEKRKNNNYRLSIWSAGCAYGEEIYSIAILLDQLVPDIKQWELNLFATDINDFALDKAKNGVFSQSSMRATDSSIIKNYFDVKNSLYYLKEHIRDKVTFSYFNIAKTCDSFVQYDLIFCRNVFIYLSRNIIEAALDYFYKHLVDEGILFLGPSDLVTHYHHDFSLHMTDEVYLLKKESSKKILPIISDIPHSDDKKINNYSYTNDLQVRATQLHSIKCSLDNRNYEDVLKKANAYLSEFGETALLYRYKGQALIGLGDIATALIYLTKSIKLDPLDAICHFLKGLTEIDMKENTAAINSLQKALYLKNKFPEASYHLGLLYLQGQQKEQGLRFLKQSLYAALDQNKDKFTTYTNESKEQFIKAVKSSILYYQGQNNEQ